LRAILEKDNAVADFRTLIGATNFKVMLKEQSEKNMQHLLVKMQFMEVIAMKTQKLKAISSLVD
jgi:hypothetical protein